jgi:hypothetical protein
MASRTIGCANSSASAGSSIASAARTSAARAASATLSSASSAASVTLAPSPRIAMARTSAVAVGGRPDSRRTIARATAAGPICRTRTAPSASVGNSCAITSCTSDSRRNGFPPVASRHAPTNSGDTAPPSRSSHTVAVASALRGRGRSTLLSGAAARRFSSAASGSAGRAVPKMATARPSSLGARKFRNRSDSVSAQWRSSTPSATGASSARLLSSQ